MNFTSPSVEILHGAEITDLSVADIHELYTHLTEHPPTKDRIQSQHVRMAESNQSYMAVSRGIGGVLLGMATINYLHTGMESTGKIDGVVRLPQIQGGVGRQIVGTALHHAFELEGCDSVTLTSSARRIAARALYQDLGFQKLETDVFTLTASDWMHR